MWRVDFGGFAHVLVIDAGVKFCFVAGVQGPLYYMTINQTLLLNQSIQTMLDGSNSSISILCIYCPPMVIKPI